MRELVPDVPPAMLLVAGMAQVEVPLPVIAPRLEMFDRLKSTPAVTEIVPQLSASLADTENTRLVESVGLAVTAASASVAGPVDRDGGGRCRTRRAGAEGRILDGRDSEAKPDVAFIARAHRHGEARAEEEDGLNVRLVAVPAFEKSAEVRPVTDSLRTRS